MKSNCIWRMMRTTINSIIEQRLSSIVLIAVISQPLIDILAYWLAPLGLSIIPLALRTVVFTLLLIVGYSISSKKAHYWLVTLIIILFWSMHSVILLKNGYDNPIADSSVYFRVVQMPLLALAFLSIMRKSEKSPVAFLGGASINLLIMAIVILASHLSGTVNYAYEHARLGSIGWFSNDNAQAIILAAVTTLALLYAYLIRNKWIFTVTVFAAFCLLFIAGTRISYYSIFAIGATWIVALILNRKWLPWHYLSLLAGLSLAGIFYTSSPVYLNKLSVESRERNWNNASPRTDSALEAQQSNLNRPLRAESNRDTNRVEEIYNQNLPVHVERFGIKRVVSAFGSTTDLGVIKDSRNQKNNFIKLHVQDSPMSLRLFGHEYADFTYAGVDFEPENDHVTIPFLYGYVGSALYIIFMLSILLNIIITATKHNSLISVPVVSGLAVIGLLVGSGLLGGHVVTRTNVIFYLSGALAYTYVVTINTAANKKPRT